MENLHNFSFSPSDIPFLRDLRLNGNPLQKVEANAFEMVPELVSLDLSSCGLRRVAARAFSHLTTLQKLDLSGNRLAELRQKTVDTIRGEGSRGEVYQ